jgi:hypothetical protein
MKIGTNFLLIGLLSLLVGSAFASPLLIVELDEIRPFNESLPKGPTANINVNVVYANFSIGDTSGDLTDISYFVVLNITNYSNDWGKIDIVQFSAAQNITTGMPSGSPSFGTNWGVLLDGKPRERGLTDSGTTMLHGFLPLISGLMVHQ